MKTFVFTPPLAHKEKTPYKVSTSPQRLVVYIKMVFSNKIQCILIVSLCIIFIYTNEIKIFI